MNFAEQFCPDCHCELCQCDDDPQPQEQTKDSSTTSPDESPAGCGPIVPVAKVDAADKIRAL